MRLSCQSSPKPQRQVRFRGPPLDESRYRGSVLQRGEARRFYVRIRRIAGGMFAEKRPLGIRFPRWGGCAESGSLGSLR